ncbi:MAG: hypothetical protein RR213_07365, partial [Raoultibacter sp.]
MDPVQRRNFRRLQVERCLASDLPISQWCRLNKIATSTFYAWAARFRKEEPNLFCESNASDWFELSRKDIKYSSALMTTNHRAIA